MLYKGLYHADKLFCKGRTINHPGGGWSVERWPDFFSSPTFFLGTKIFGPKLGPIFFSLFTIMPYGGKINGLDFLFFQKF